MKTILSFMEKENEGVEEIDEIVETQDDEGNDLTDWKAEALKHQGIAKRFKTKFEKAEELKAEEAKKKAEAPTEKTEKKDFDYAEMAYLEAKDISEEDYPIVLEAIKSTGKSLKDVLGNKYIQAEIKEAKENRDSKNAIPIGAKRSTSSSRDEVGYWLAKGELPPADQRELRQKVVDAKIKKAEGASMFTNRPVA